MTSHLRLLHYSTVGDTTKEGQEEFLKRAAILLLIGRWFKSVRWIGSLISPVLSDGTCLLACNEEGSTYSPRNKMSSLVFPKTQQVKAVSCRVLKLSYWREKHQFSLIFFVNSRLHAHFQKSWDNFYNYIVPVYLEEGILRPLAAGRRTDRRATDPLWHLNGVSSSSSSSSSSSLRFSLRFPP